MNANLRYDIGPGAADAAPSSLLVLMQLYEKPRPPKYVVSRGEIGEVKREVIAFLVDHPASTVKSVRAFLGDKYSIARINSALSQLHSSGRAKRVRRGHLYYYTVRTEG